LSIGALRFFRSARGERGSGSRTARFLRFLGQRQMSVSEASSRPKPPEAGAEGQPLRGFAHRRPSPVEIEGPRGCPSAAPFLAAHRAFPPAKTCVVVGMRQLLVRVGSDRPGQDPGRTPSIAAAAAFDVLVLLGAPEDRASGAFAFGRGLDFPPFLIDPRRPFMRLRPRACMLVSGGVGTPDQ